MSFTKEIELYYASTPNGWKVEIALEELGIPYKVINVDISKGEQFKPEFLAISPNNRIPAIVDPNSEHPIPIFESGAILIYLAQKAGKLLPDAKQDPAGNADVLQWVMWQMGGLGPMLGQFNHFNAYAPEKIPYAIERYTKEAHRLLKVLDTQLSKQQFVAKVIYSIADIMIWGWIAFLVWKKPLEVPSHVQRWYEEVAKRPAVAKLIPVYQERDSKRKPLTDEEKKVLFGIDKKEKRMSGPLKEKVEQFVHDLHNKRNADNSLNHSALVEGIKALIELYIVEHRPDCFHLLIDEKQIGDFFSVETLEILDRQHVFINAELFSGILLAYIPYYLLEVKKQFMDEPKFKLNCAAIGLHMEVTTHRGKIDPNLVIMSMLSGSLVTIFLFGGVGLLVYLAKKLGD